MSDEIDITRIEEALRFIPADCDRKLWVRMAMAVKSAKPGNDGFDAWDKWSQKAPDKYNSKDAKTVWNSVDAKQITIGSLLYEAKARGWRPSSDGSNGQGNNGSWSPYAAVYDYVGADGLLSYQVCRTKNKGFPQRRPDPARRGAFIDNMHGVIRLPYRLPELMQAVSEGKTIFIPEGEKDVDRCRKHGLAASCNSGGGGNWQAEINEHFRGADVVILPDNDETGRKHRDKVARQLRGIAKRVVIVELPGLKETGDISDWFDAGHTVDDLNRLVAEARDKAVEGIFIHSGKFVEGFMPPEYLVEGIIQRRYFYSWTGMTGHAKTSIGLELAMAIGLLGTFGSVRCERGRVGYFALENPDDIRTRWIGLCDHHGVDPKKPNVYFSTSHLDVGAMVLAVAADAQRLGGFDLVIIDTGSAMFAGNDINNDKEMIEFAQTLRRLLDHLGDACLIAMMHPIKAANHETLIPKGGGGFLNQVDGNFTCWNADGIVEFHWQGKLRGPGFEPLMWEIVPTTCERLKDGKGRLIPTVVAKHLDDASAERKTNDTRREQEKVLKALRDVKDISLGDIAKRYGWITADGQPYKMKVKRQLEALRREGFTSFSRNRWRITDKGKTEIKEPTAKTTAAEDVE